MLQIFVLYLVEKYKFNLACWYKIITSIYYALNCLKNKAVYFHRVSDQ